MLQFLLSGVAIGAIYGLIGMALAITFYVTRIINFAQGQLMMATIMVTAEFLRRAIRHGSRVAGLASSCVLGVLSYLIAVRPILASIVQFRLARQYAWLRRDRRERRGLYLGPDVAGLSADPQDR